MFSAFLMFWLFFSSMARYDHMVCTWTCLSLRRLWHNRSWQRKEMLIFFNNTWWVFQSSSETPGPDHFQWQMAVAHGTKPSGRGMQPSLTPMESSAAACQFFLYNWGIYLCGPQLLNMPDRSGSVPSQRSISHRGASAIRQLQKRWTLSFSSQRLEPAAAGLALHQGVTAVLKSSLTV